MWSLLYTYTDGIIITHYCKSYFHYRNFFTGAAKCPHCKETVPPKFYYLFLVQQRVAIYQLKYKDIYDPPPIKES